MSFRAGYYFRRNGLSYNSLMNGNITHAYFSKRWQARGDEKHTDVPSMVYPNDNRRNGFYEQSAINTLKGDHVRIQDIIFGYHFSGIRKLKAIGVRSEERRVGKECVST